MPESPYPMIAGEERRTRRAVRRAAPALVLAGAGLALALVACVAPGAAAWRGAVAVLLGLAAGGLLLGALDV